jgi:multiple sugar transport system substrate-binding protein
MQSLKRRQFLKAAALATAGTALAACQPRIVEVTKVVERVVKEEVIVAGTPQIVEKVVKETVVVKEATVAPKAKVLVRNIVWGASAPMIPMYESFAQTFMAERPEITIEYLFQPGDQYVARLKTMEAAGDPPEVCMPIGGAINYWRAPDFNKWLDITPLAERDAYDFDDFHKFSIQSAKNPFTGTMDGLPVQLFSGVIVYNKDLFDAEGLPYPPHEWGTDAWSMDALIELALKLTKDENGLKPGQPGFNQDKIAQFGFFDPDMDPYYGWIKGGEGVRTHPTDRFHIYVGEKPYIEGCDTWVDWVYNKRLMPKPVEQQEFQGTLSSPFHTGKVAMAVGMTWNVESYFGIKNFKFDFAARPHGWVRDRYLNRLCMDQGTMFAQAKHHDQSWDWIKFCASPEMAFRFSVDLRQCLPCRISAIPKYGERLAMRLPDVDGDVMAKGLGYAWYSEYWSPQIGWEDTYNPARDAVKLNNKKGVEAWPPAQVALQKMFDDYYKQFPNLQIPPRMTM